MFDIIIENGTVIDGTGSSSKKSDLGIIENKITEIGSLSNADAKKRINAQGKIVAPGFIDIHTHSSFNEKKLELGANMNYIQQGVTTVISGNCGASPVDFEQMKKDIIDNKDGPNIGMLIGHNAIRKAVMEQKDAEPTEKELNEMKSLLGKAMENGALGFSSGLWYIPGTYSKIDEVIELAKEAAKHGGFYATHMRSEDDKILESLKEAITIGKESGLPVQISHHKVMGPNNWGLTKQTLQMVEAARQDGIDIILDQYPYIAYGTCINIIIPRWVFAGNDDDARARFNDPKTRAKIKEEIIQELNTFYAGELERIRIAKSTIEPSLVGMTLAEIADKRGATDKIADMADFVIDIVKGTPSSSDTACVYHMMCEEDLERVIKYPYTAIGSDGGSIVMNEGHPHPRGYGTFPRVIARYCREKKFIGLEEAIRKMTSLPASRLGITDRGVIKEGAHADITIFDFEKINDKATFLEPHQYPVGINNVIVNGEVVLNNGEHTGSLPGAFLSRN